MIDIFWKTRQLTAIFKTITFFIYSNFRFFGQITVEILWTNKPMTEVLNLQPVVIDHWSGSSEDLYGPGATRSLWKWSCWLFFFFFFHFLLSTFHYRKDGDCTDHKTIFDSNSCWPLGGLRSWWWFSQTPLPPSAWWSHYWLGLRARPPQTAPQTPPQTPPVQPHS